MTQKENKLKSQKSTSKTEKLRAALENHSAALVDFKNEVRFCFKSRIFSLELFFKGKKKVDDVKSTEV